MSARVMTKGATLRRVGGTLGEEVAAIDLAKPCDQAALGWIRYKSIMCCAFSNKQWARSSKLLSPSNCMFAAYDALSEDLKQRLQSLHMVHSYEFRRYAIYTAGSRATW